MKKMTLVKYTLLTYIVSWVLWICLMVLVNAGKAKYGEPVFMLLYLFGGIFPSIAAFIAIRKNKAAARTLKTEMGRFKVGVLWYAAIIAAPLIISGIMWLFNRVSQRENNPFLQGPVYMVAVMLPVMIIGGGSEEIGWRGVLLSELLVKLNPFKATLIVSVIWGIWHLPLWFIPGLPQYGSNFLYFLMGTFSMSFLLTVIYAGTRSVFLCILFHAFENAWLNIGMDSWASGPVTGLLNATGGLIISMLIFRLYFKVKPLKQSLFTQFL